MVSSKKTRNTLDTSFATIAFILSLLFWVPLFNLFSTPISLIFAIISLYKQHKEPTMHGGFKRALAALIIGCVEILLVIYALIVIGPDVIFKR